MALPVVGLGGAGITRLSPKVKRVLKRRAKASVHAEYRPDIQAAKAQVGALRHGARSEVAGARSASNFVQNSIDAQIKAARKSGLRGTTLQQTLQELTAQKADAAKEVPFEASQIHADYAEKKAAALTDLAQIRGQRASDVHSTYRSSLDKAYTEAKSTVKARRTKKDAAAKTRSDNSRDMKNALAQARAIFIQGPNREDGDPWRAPSTDAEWAHFEQAVGTAEGVDPTLAHDAMIRFRQQLIKQNLAAAGKGGEQVLGAAVARLRGG